MALFTNLSKIRIVFLIVFLLIGTKSFSQSVVINKIFNTGLAAGLDDGIEVLVITNNLDMRGMIVKDFNNNVTDDAGSYTFSTNTVWSKVRSGTLIVLRKSTATTSLDVSSSGTDFNLDFSLNDTEYFSGAGVMDITNIDMIMIKAAGTGTSGVTGSIHAFYYGNGTPTELCNSVAAPKLRGLITGGVNTYVYCVNSTSNITDFAGTNASASTTVAFGSANSTTNNTYINGLRAIVLPVNLISYTAKTQNNNTVLNWKTGSETYNSHFLLESSEDGITFNLLAKVDAKSANGSDYSYTDNHILNGTNYYRLMQVDLNGKTTDLGIRSVKADLTKEDFQVYPNPMSSNVNLSFTGGIYEKAIVTDVVGKIVSIVPIGKVQNSIDMDVTAVNPGTYFIQLTGAKNKTVKTVIKN